MPQDGMLALVRELEVWQNQWPCVSEAHGLELVLALTELLSGGDPERLDAMIRDWIVRAREEG